MERANQSKLLQDRLAKIQAEMAAHDVGALLLVNPVNVRYATGVSVMPIWTALNLARYALVPVKGDPILFEYGKALFRAQEVWPNARAATAWQYRFSQHESENISRRWATEIAGQLAEWGLKGARVAVDPIDALGFRALEAQGLTLTDTDPVMEAAKLVKTPDEIYWIKQSCMVAEAALAEMEKAIVPGISENELYGVFHKTMLSLGGEFCSTRLLVSGEKTNPWFYEADDRRVRPGDLVAIDTDMTGPQGYLCDISRTFLCGDKANPDQREAYAVAKDFIEAMTEMCRVGEDYQRLVERAPKYPAEYEQQGYSCMIHGSGYDDEPPFLPFPHEKKSLVPRGALQENMVLSVEFYAGKKGKRDGVKLEDQILITAKGPELLSRYPWESKLL